ncbi:MAG: cytochrome c [Ardenticatenaceae bacterium]|nr:cytochrome c [Ardenticatenaceae bacterium]
MNRFGARRIGLYVLAASLLVLLGTGCQLLGGARPTPTPGVAPLVASPAASGAPSTTPAGQPPLAETRRPVPVTAGERAALGAPVYLENCSPCHGIEGQGVDAPALRNNSYIQTAGDQALFTTIANGFPGTEMPAWRQANGGPLTDGQITDVIAYLHTLQGLAPLPTSTPVPAAPTETPLPQGRRRPSRLGRRRPAVQDLPLRWSAMPRGASRRLAGTVRPAMVPPVSRAFPTRGQRMAVCRC